jgi:hypothetical protein
MAAVREKYEKYNKMSHKRKSRISLAVVVDEEHYKSVNSGKKSMSPINNK